MATASAAVTKKVAAKSAKPVAAKVAAVKVPEMEGDVKLVFHNPTLTALQKNPFAVITWMAPADSPEKVERDFEWFIEWTNCNDYYKEVVAFYRADHQNNADTIYLIAEMSDTETLSVSRVDAFGPDSVLAKQWKEKVVKDPSTLIFVPKTMVRAPKVTPELKGRAKSEAGAAMQPVIQSPAKPKGPRRVKPSGASGAVAEQAKVEAPPAKPSAREEVLRKRLAAKQQEQGGTPTPILKPTGIREQAAANKVAVPQAPAITHVEVKPKQPVLNPHTGEIKSAVDLPKPPDKTETEVDADAARLSVIPKGVTPGHLAVKPPKSKDDPFYEAVNAVMAGADPKATADKLIAGVK